MKKILLVSIILFCYSKSQAQVKIHLGATTAMNSTFVLDKGLKADPRYLSTATYKWAPVGLSFGIDLGKRFGLQLESIKAAQGQFYEVRDALDKVVGSRNFDMTYLQFPLMLKMMGGSDKAARMNFQIGPQLSIIQTGTEILKYAQSFQKIPDGVVPPQDAILQPDGTYEVPAVDEIISGTDKIQGAVYKFKETEIQLAAAIGFDIDIMRNFYLSTNIRANYSFTDMRGQDLIDLVQSGSVSEIFNQRANLAVGMQLGLHWMIGGTRRANAKDKKLRDAMKSDSE